MYLRKREETLNVRVKQSSERIVKISKTNFVGLVRQLDPKPFEDLENSEQYRATSWHDRDNMEMSLAKTLWGTNDYDQNVVEKMLNNENYLYTNGTIILKEDYKIELM